MLLAHGDYKSSFYAPEGGRLTITWNCLRVIVADGTATFARAGHDCSTSCSLAAAGPS